MDEKIENAHQDAKKMKEDIKKQRKDMNDTTCTFFIRKLTTCSTRSLTESWILNSSLFGKNTLYISNTALFFSSLLQ